MPDQKLHETFKIATLISLEIRGEISAEEKQELEEWKKVSVENRRLYNELLDEQLRAQQLRQLGSFDLKSGWDVVTAKMYSRKVWYRLPVFRYAAAIILIAGSALAIWLTKNVKDSNNTKAIVAEIKNDVPPGNTKAYIKVATGQNVLLDDTSDSSFYAAGTLIQQQNGQLLLPKGKQSDKAVQQLSLYTPKGGQYRITLSDGTRAWINSASSLQFPDRFMGSDRRVLLTGEAYFEVAHNPSIPFIVTVNNTEVKALGTAFNVRAYSDDDDIEAALVEGVVHVIAGNGNAVLAPGKQATVTASDIKVGDANIAAITAWKNGLFVFRDMPLEEVMKQVSRWYDINVVYVSGFQASSTFTGRIDRNVPISRLLRLMEQTSIARFNLSGRTLTVLPYETTKK